MQHQHFAKLSFFLACAVCAPLWASPIVYSDSDIASGTLDGVAFTNQLVTVNFFGDTDQLSGGDSFYAEPVGTGTVTIGNAAPVTLTDSYLEFFDNQSDSYAGISIEGLGSVLDTENSIFATYTGSTALPATSGTVYYNSAYDFSTTGGVLNFTTAGATSTFTATVPEPSSVILIGSGAVLLLKRARRV
jgi:hypothetical protein